MDPRRPRRRRRHRGCRDRAHGRALATTTLPLGAAPGNTEGHSTDREPVSSVGARAFAAGGAPHFHSHMFDGSTAAELRAAIDYGVVKVNLDTDAQYAFTRAVAGHVLDHWDGVLHIDGGLGAKRAYDPRAWGRKAEDAMARRVAEAAEQLGAAGRTLATPR